MSSINVDTIKSREGGPPTLSKGVVVSAAATFSTDVTIAGVLTYEDVTNVDSIGIITARSGIKFGAAGIGGTIRANGDTTLAGVVTATSFSGNLAWFSGSMYETSTSFGSTSSFAHLAFVANGDGTVTIFKDGTSAGTSGSLISAAPPSQNTLWGQDTSYGGIGMEFRGFRFNTNKVYTSNFTPPSINGGLTDISGTVALWDGLTGSATDASGTNTWSATNMTFSLV